MGREDELFDKYMLIRQMVEAVRNKNTSKAGPLGDTTRGRGRVLALLKQKDGVSTKEMATVMGIRVSSLNEVLSKMEKDGFVERSASPDDRRVMLVWLTDKGKAIELPDQHMPQIIFGTLNQGAQNQLCMYFEQMISSLQGELEEEGEAIKEAREQRSEFFESAKQGQASQQQVQSQPAAQTQASSAPRPAPAAPPTGAPFAPPTPPVSTPPRIG
ncbi:MAG: MarR family transcriptional regulator [Coriobacteriales bacterium]